MNNNNETDYEKLYHLINKNRRFQFEKLEEAREWLNKLYVLLAERDKRFASDSDSWERKMLIEAMARLYELNEEFIITDKMIEESVITQFEPVLEVFSGGKKPHESEECTILEQARPAPGAQFSTRFSLELVDILREIDRQIENFLLKFEQRQNLKCFIAAKTAIRLLMIERSEIPGTVALYQKIADQVGGTKTTAERNLRSFRESERVRNSDYYVENLSDYDSDNTTFYWRAVQLIETALSDEIIQYLWKMKR